MAGDFDSAWLKFGWGFRHGQRLLAENERFVASGPKLQEAVTYDASASELVLSVACSEDPPAAMALTLADVLSCCRQALDHVAWAMVLRGSASPSNQVHFPIVDHPNGFAGEVTNKLPGVSAADRGLVRLLHDDHIWPYGTSGEAPLCRMRTLNNHEKHRTIQLVSALPSSVNVQGTFQDCTAAGEVQMVIGVGQRLMAGMDIIRVPVHPTGPHPTMVLSGSIETIVAIDGVAVEGFINEVLQTIQHEVLSHIQPMPPSELYELGTGISPPPGGSGAL